jgi:hypothetical protein
MKYDPTSKRKLFIAIRKDSALRVLGKYSLVMARKIGLPPSGSTMGYNALRIRKRFFVASTTALLLIALPEGHPRYDNTVGPLIHSNVRRLGAYQARGQ